MGLDIKINNLCRASEKCECISRLITTHQLMNMHSWYLLTFNYILNTFTAQWFQPQCSSLCVRSHWDSNSPQLIVSVSERCHRSAVWQHDWYSYRLNKYLHQKFIERIHFLFAFLLALEICLVFVAVVFAELELLAGIISDAEQDIHRVKWVVLLLNTDNLFGCLWYFMLLLLLHRCLTLPNFQFQFPLDALSINVRCVSSFRN